MDEVNYNIDSEIINCIIFIKKNYRVLAVDIKNYTTRRRNENTIDFIFSASPKNIFEIEKYFNNFYTGEKFYFSISNTDFRPVYFKGISLINKEILDDVLPKQSITLFTAKGKLQPENFHFVPNYDDYKFKFVGDKYD